MGGWGSGQWLRSDSKETTESQHGIDIRYMKNGSLLTPGTTGFLSWTRNGRQTGFINYRMERNRLVLSYRYRFLGGEWEEAEEVVSFDRTACNYGGQRIWLLCPQCRRRVVLLYGAGQYFLCRHCHKLTYATQQERRQDRFMRKARELRERLGGGRNLLEPIPERPKGMHWRTYRRLHSEYERASQIVFAMILARISGTRGVSNS